MELLNTTLRITNTSAGVVVSYGCADGYRDESHEDANITCNEQLEWTGTWLQCEGGKLISLHLSSEHS